MVTPAFSADITVGPACTLRDAIIAANADMVQASCAAGSGSDTIILEANSTITLSAVDPLGDSRTGLPIITSDISIQGNNSTITRDESSPGFRLLEVDPGGQLSIDSLTLSKGSNFAGSAIRADDAGTLRITNSTITQNSSTGVDLNDTNLYIDNSTISANSSVFRAGIDVSRGNIHISNSSITGNSASRDGAGMYFYGGSLTLINSEISGNIAEGDAGLYAYSMTGDAIIKDSRIINNVAISEPDAGAVFIGETLFKLRIENTQVSGNTASFGAGMYASTTTTLSNSTVTIVDSSISNNVDTLSPPRLASFAGFQVRNRIDLTMRSSEVSNNRSDGISGLVLLGGDVGYQHTVSIQDSTIDNNANQLDNLSPSFGTGGSNVVGLNAREIASLELINTHITNNRGDGYGGLGISDGPATITGGSLSNNYVKSQTRRVFFAYESDLKIDGLTVSGNSAAQTGSGMKFTNYSGGGLSIKNSTFSGNTSPSGTGSAIFTNNTSNVEIANSTFSGNGGAGQAVYIGSPSQTVSITNVTFASNTSTSGASGLGFSGPPTTFNLNNTVLAGNGGGDCLSQLTFTGTNNWFSDATCNGVAQGNALLGLLANNRGDTQTHALLSNSPLIDAGNNTICSAPPIGGSDQRGESHEGVCDIGAYEFIPEGFFFVIPNKKGGASIINL